MVGTRRRVSKGISPLVREAVESILERAVSKPRRIVLFGSEARGEAAPDSDIDLLLVLDRCDEEALEAARDAVYDVMWRHDFERLISVQALSAEQFEDWRRKGFGFAKNVDREGIVLWRAA